MQQKPDSLLEGIVFPADLRKLEESQLGQVSDELRNFIIDVVSTNPGHFGASLGVVELTVALHYVFDTPKDILIWDVGHQAYGHKILTGRRKEFHTNRKYKGLAGFPNRAESAYDAFGVGHSSTSISAALGMAVAAAKEGKKKQVVAIIGDGAMTAGMAFEGLNHAGIENTDVLIILNDNGISIDPNVGALHEYLLDITTSHTYNILKDETWKILTKLKKFANIRDVVQKLENGIKAVLLKESNLFEALNFRYFGPIDGHNISHLVKILSDLKDIPGPKLLHVITKKGKGFMPAELEQTKWHAPGLFNKDTGLIIKSGSSAPKPPRFQDVFGHSLVELAEANLNIVGVTPAMPSGSSLNIMMEAMPDRAFDVGIAEQHAVTFSAGMATQGILPFCNIYSSFMQRAYDQVIHDVALQKLNVVFCLDRGGLVGADGATHHGVYDIAYMRCIPNITIASPYNEQELRNLMYTAQLPDMGTWCIRYPRGNGSMTDWRTPFEKLEVGKGRMVLAGRQLAVLSIGAIGVFAQEAIAALGNTYSVAHYDMRFVKPLDEGLLHQIFGEFDHVITVEDGCVMGGFGSAVIEFMVEHGYSAKVKRLGVPDRFVEHGTVEELFEECGYDAIGIAEAIRGMIPVLEKQKVY
jgi:1-deoxy-D-xylulose-5-phosphate synthase